MTSSAGLATNNFPSWCPGCGNFTIWAAFRNSATVSGWDNTNSVIVAGIGCHGHIVNFIKMTSFEGLHGRALPVASGIKLANNRLNVFVFTGDGDCLAEGGNHFIHACRRNHDLTIILHDNAVYGLTTGQSSPASPHGYKSISTHEGDYEYPISPSALAIASGATFVARAYSGQPDKLSELIVAANNHRGLAVIDVLQPCVTFNKEYTHQYFQSNTYYLGSDYDLANKDGAFGKSLEWGPKQIPLGILYRVEKPTYESQVPQISQGPLVEQRPQSVNADELFKTYV